jgi:hypothetical protein
MDISRHNKPWSMNEINRLHNEYEIKNYSIYQIAKLHKRKNNAIYYQLIKQGFTIDNEEYLLEDDTIAYDDDGSDSDYVPEEDDDDESDYESDDDLYVSEDEDNDEDDQEYKDSNEPINKVISKTQPLSQEQQQDDDDLDLDDIDVDMSRNSVIRNPAHRLPSFTMSSRFSELYTGTSKRRIQQLRRIETEKKKEQNKIDDLSKRIDDIEAFLKKRFFYKQEENDDSWG